MRLDRLKAFALALPQTTVVRQWGEHLVFKVAGKMFLITGEDPGVLDGLTIKCTPEEFDELTEIDGIMQAPYCAKRHWVRVADPTVLPETQLLARIRRSYDLVVARLPRKVQAVISPAVPPR
ncbi:MmcQ/YjbR family DNA-binding protein [Opitutus sp. GAS368]|jgi:predicted DNA-binding protein (MmcQ/YjbR family)|uniref:MmcQ/YjbR family DNA-binding protein n=1 Tax=Opitutus sp. GAS368 TaxID=1882749 RepID=UPI00087B92DE|nr:MmcQ/YjbR family DNA-binding protein [Opitutus sp. GAS368]SDS23715.1 Predicted DNA-binding protein, MmcQ/YjbR family [Opitutus sp. GAS368]